MSFKSHVKKKKNVLKASKLGLTFELWLVANYVMLYCGNAFVILYIYNIYLRYVILFCLRSFENI